MLCVWGANLSINSWETFCLYFLYVFCIISSCVDGIETAFDHNTILSEFFPPYSYFHLHEGYGRNVGYELRNILTSTPSYLK